MSDHVLDHPHLGNAGAELPRTGFSADAENTDGSLVLRLEGELDMATAPTLRRALGAALDTRPTRVALDLRHLSFVDSTGISVLIAAGRRAEGEGCSFVLRAPCRSVLRVLRLTGVDRLVRIEPGATSA